MGLFADDTRQDERLDALELHVRLLTQRLHATQADLATSRIAMLSLKAQIDSKVAAEDVDPTLLKLNEDLGKAREQLAQASAAATEGWGQLQEEAQQAFEKLRTNVDAAYERLGKDAE